jgi:chromosome segregation ATPase
MTLSPAPDLESVKERLRSLALMLSEAETGSEAGLDRWVNDALAAIEGLESRLHQTEYTFGEIDDLRAKLEATSNELDIVMRLRAEQDRVKGDLIAKLEAAREAIANMVAKNTEAAAKLEAAEASYRDENALLNRVNERYWKGQAEITRLREALEKIVRAEPRNPDPWQNAGLMAGIARAALSPKEGK